MVTVTLEPGESRPHYMLRVAAAYIREHWTDGLIFFDEAECDGYCVADDCEHALLELDEEGK